MAKLKLSFVTGRHDRVAPLIDGEVEVEGAELVPTVSDASETFWRQLHFGEFDVSEMSLSSFLIARERGLEGGYLPVFPNRQLFWTGWSYHVDSGIKTANDLVGKSIGVGEYQQTAALWMRGIFEHDFGVSQFSVDWWMERTEALSHGGATGFKPMDGIKFHRIPTDKSLATMLLNHELDCATIGRALTPETNIIDRSTTIRPPATADWSKIKPLFPDRIAEGARFFQKWGFVPANHGYIIRADVYKEHPWLAFNLYKAFVASKEMAEARFPREIPSVLFFGREYLDQTKKIFGGKDFVPYGVQDNHKMLETAIMISNEQGFIKVRPKPEELFPEILRSL